MLVGGRAEYLMERNQRTTVLAVVVLLGMLLHVSLALALVPLARRLERRPEALRSVTSEIDFEAPPPPAPPAPPEPQASPPPAPPEPEVHEPPRPQPARVVHQAAPEPPPPPPPAPTQAAPVMVVEEEFSNEGQEAVATGNNPNATGDTSSDGVMRGPGQGVTGAQHGGTANGTGRGPVVAAPPAVPPRIDYASRSEANCDSEAARDQFPQAAMEAGITEMVVRLRIEVDANGRVTRVQPLNNPGFGFAAAAERVVRSHCQFRPARDHEGHAVPYVFGSFPVTFELE